MRSIRRTRRARRLMESVARAEGDVDALIAIVAADLDDQGQSHLRIARELDGAGRGDEADWADVAARGECPDERSSSTCRPLRRRGSRLATSQLGRARFQAEGRWLTIRRCGGPRRFGHLARRTGPGAGLLREDARHQRAQVRWAWGGPVLVDALLDDGDLDAAWAAAKRRHRRAVAAAGRRAAADPPGRRASVVPPVDRVDEEETGDPVYRRMASLLLSARACHQALDSTEQFNRYSPRCARN